MIQKKSDNLQHLQQYESDGFLLIQNLFTQKEVEIIRNKVNAAFREESPRRVLEKDGKTVRSVYGLHLNDPLFKRLVRDPRILPLVQEILKGEVYVHQSKANAKLALDGDMWSWHQDYTFWLKEDGVPAPTMTTVAIFLDDVTEFNGPISFIPGSHKQVVLNRTNTEVPPGYEDEAPWISNLTADLKYSVPKETLSPMIENCGIAVPKGSKGSVLFIHANVVHGSAPNLSPYDRVLTLLTYNRVENAPISPEIPRPEFLCGRDYAPITTLRTPLMPEKWTRIFEQGTRLG